METQTILIAAPDDTATRRYPRYQLPLPVSILVSDDREEATHPETVSLRDISLTGLYFFSDRAYESGRHLAVQIALAGRDYRLRVLVQRSQLTHSQGRAVYGIAVLFVRGDEIHPFLADLATFLNHAANPFG